MTKDDMIRLARKAGLWSKYGAVMMNDDVAFVHAQTGDWPELQAFADLCAVLAAEQPPARQLGADFGVTADQPALKHHCQNGTADVCLAGSRDGICCPPDSCDIDDGARPTPQPSAARTDELIAWECCNCGELHRQNEDRCGCGWTRERGRAEFKPGAVQWFCERHGVFAGPVCTSCDAEVVRAADKSDEG
jgi:hypothetical protein